MLVFNSASGRMAIGNHDLHCGECFDLFHVGSWHPVRIEHACGSWVLVGLGAKWDNALDYEGLQARMGH